MDRREHASGEPSRDHAVELTRAMHAYRLPRRRMRRPSSLWLRVLVVDNSRDSR
jgi:hypothetical protein